ncbi:damage-control phosphatase ARMT1 family protein [Saccharicrinis fermentans]|uniref:Damage-control phosphatase ARMT1-like metal-binding domain-containing protein n=1 Tax=Saccharicrinis fermentans DSM 9555 = JCM 21142 TaxID=869213 RepID=W7YL76_9BACT|nr:ARMT1-like domain-containing protein [Saccharicrinis fermentans]GAF05301.1 hypothetical protein JCM21142_104030 [Saccharicrinis fermentans DSM 9555 = JCM 21142]
MDALCSQCHLKSVNKLIAKFKPSREIAKKIQEEARNVLSAQGHLPNPYVATYMQRLVKGMMQVDNLYSEEKQRANEVLLSNYKYWKDYVLNSENPFFTAVQLALAGNVIDYGADTVPEDINRGVKELTKKNLSKQAVLQLEHDITKAKKILYLGDNAGEIVFDKLLIEIMHHPHVTYVVRGESVINDVTMEDVAQTGIDQVCRVISNGYDAPSTLYECCSSEFKKAYDSADLIISKGQGNFEGLMHAKHSHLYFLLMAKCKPIAQMLHVAKGDLVIKKYR